MKRAETEGGGRVGESFGRKRAWRPWLLRIALSLGFVRCTTGGDAPAAPEGADAGQRDAAPSPRATSDADADAGTSAPSCADEAVIEASDPRCGVPYTCCVETLVPPARCSAAPIVADCTEGWCRIPAGCFVMGSPACLPGRMAFDGHAVVELTRSYVIQQFETTAATWKALGFEVPTDLHPAAVCEGTDAECPVVAASWFDALEFANRMSDREGLPRCYVLEGCTVSPRRPSLGACTRVEAVTNPPAACLGFRVPSEAEWERAARAGTQTANYAGHGSYAVAASTRRKDDTLSRIAWFDESSGSKVQRIGGKVPNGFGLYDILGNVWEWTTGSREDRVSEPTVDPEGTLRVSGLAVVRGGTALAQKAAAQSGARVSDLRSGAAGIRLVRTLP